MSSINEALKQARSVPKDERQEAVRQRSSYVAFCAFLATYLVVAFVYTVRNASVPFSTQLLLMVATIVFAAYTLKGEGAQFRLPVILETKTTLNQPAAVRSVPWIILFSGLILYPITGIAGAIQDYLYWAPRLSAEGLVIGSVIGLILTTLISYWMARWIKEGRAVFMGLFVLGCVFSIPAYLVEIANAYVPESIRERFLSYLGGYLTAFPTGNAFPVASLAILYLVIYLWCIYVVLRYWSLIVRDGAAYQREIGVPTQGTVFSWVAKIKSTLFLWVSAIGYLVFNVLNDTLGQHQNGVDVIIWISSAIGGFSLMLALVSLTMKKEKSLALWVVFVGIIVVNIVAGNFAR